MTCIVRGVGEVNR